MGEVAGKAMYQMLRDMEEHAEAWAGRKRKVIFLHTGGLLGLYEKTDQLAPLVEGLGKAHRLQV